MKRGSGKRRSRGGEFGATSKPTPFGAAASATTAEETEEKKAKGGFETAKEHLTGILGKLGMAGGNCGCAITGGAKKRRGSKKRRGTKKRRGSKKRRATKRVRFHHPKKGQRSRTMKGRKDFTTKKHNKYFNRRGHRQSRSSRGIKRRPYHRR